MDRLEGSEVGRLLKFKGSSRLEVKDDLTETILGTKNIVLPGGFRFRFIESRKYSGPGGEWAEYEVLYSVLKYEQSFRYLQTVLSGIKDIKFPEVDYLEISEFDSSRPKYYYILLYMRRDIGEEREENEINLMFKDLETDE